MRRAAEAEAELEQRVSLALWRMDTELAPIVAEEVIRPPSAYRPLTTRRLIRPRTCCCSSRRGRMGRGNRRRCRSSYSRGLPQLAELSTAVDLPQLLAELPDTPLPTAAELNRSIAAAQIGPIAEQARSNWTIRSSSSKATRPGQSDPPEPTTKEPVQEVVRQRRRKAGAIEIGRFRSSAAQRYQSCRAAKPHESAAASNRRPTCAEHRSQRRRSGSDHGSAGRTSRREPAGVDWRSACCSRGASAATARPSCKVAGSIGRS